MRVKAKEIQCQKCGLDVTNRRSCPECKTLVVWVARPKKIVALESRVKADIRKALVENGVLCWVHNVDNRNMSTGLGLGTADLICVVPPHGRFLGIEVKRPGQEARTSEAQKEWLAVVKKFGGMSGIASSVEDALELVRLARTL